MMKLVGYALVAIALLCLPFTVRQGLLGINNDSAHFMTALYYLVSAVVLFLAGMLVLRKFDDGSSTSRRYSSSSSRIKIG